MLTPTRLHLRRSGFARAALAAAVAVSACSTETLLEVHDPDIINPDVVSDAAGAAALRAGALARFQTATSGNENLFGLASLLADEFRSSDTFAQRNEIDQRRTQTNNTNLTSAQRDAQGARVSALQAAEALQRYAPTKVTDLAEMYLVQAFMENMFAEVLCSGVPLTTPSQLGEPMATGDVLRQALAHADSALATVAADASGTRVRTAAAIVKGRILVNQGQLSQASAAVAAVPTDFRYNNEHSLALRSNAVWNINNNSRRFTIVDRDGDNGLDYITAGDPRVPVAAVARAAGFDGTTDLYRQLRYPAPETPFNLISGIEARLIEAEAKVGADPVAALAVLNALRAGTHRLGAITVVALPALALQSGRDAQVDQLFRERAFWLFTSGHRLGDLRRLIRQYGRNEGSVFPTGTYFKGGTYGTDVNLPVTQPEENNENFRGCLDRKA